VWISACNTTNIATSSPPTYSATNFDSYIWDRRIILCIIRIMVFIVPYPHDFNRSI
jgi:hypothetical protein